MLLLSIVVQLVPAAVLLAWLGSQPLRSLLGCVVQIVATGAFLWALARVGLWIWPSVWTPWLLILLWLVVSAVALKRRIRQPFWPWWLSRVAWAEWLGIVVLGGIGAYAGDLALEAERGRTPLPGPLIDIAPPFAAGRFLVAHGGSTPTVNPHLRTLEPGGARRQAFRGQSHALDILMIDALGRRGRGLQPADPTAYHIFGETVLAPCTGVVRHAVDALPDMPVPERDTDNLAGNHVVIDCGEAEIVLAHLQFGSVRVAAGDAIVSGEPVARVGNSGNTTEPHLHIHAQTPGTAEAPLSGEPLQLTIDGSYLVRNDHLVIPEAP